MCVEAGTLPRQVFLPSAATSPACFQPTIFRLSSQYTQPSRSETPMITGTRVRPPHARVDA
eukprot:6212789-Pleurochrysis_carterae.AAC.3